MRNTHAITKPAKYGEVTENPVNPKKSQNKWGMDASCASSLHLFVNNSIEGPTFLPYPSTRRVQCTCTHTHTQIQSSSSLSCLDTFHLENECQFVNFLSDLKSVVLNQSNFVPRGTFGNAWTHKNCHKLEVGATGIWWIEASSGAVKCPTMHRTDFHNKESSGPKYYQPY